MTDDSPADVDNPATPHPGAPDRQSAKAEPSDPAPPDPGAVHPAGDPRVDEALSRLEPLDQLGVEEHVGVYAEVHDALRAALDSPPEPAAGEQHEPSDAPPPAS